MIRQWLKKKVPFSSKSYWENRYQNGNNSGCGSYNELAKFKADIINQLIKEQQLHSFIELGTGDGNQLTMMQYPKYLGLDVSAKAINICVEKFKGDHTKSFMLYDGGAFCDNAGFIKADVSLSLDVLYHLVELPVYEKYLVDLFAMAERMVIIYSTNELLPQFSHHEHHRVFTKDVERLAPGWRLAETIKNKYSVAEYGEDRGSRADFFIYKRV